MQTRQIKIEEATEAQLRTFASTILALELEGNVDTREKLIAAITLAWNQPFITLPEEDELVLDGSQVVTPEPTAQEIGLNNRHYRHDPKVTLTILTTDRPGGKEPAAPSVNGSPCLVIPRGKPVTIPYRFYLALKEAHEVKFEQDEKFNWIETRHTNYPLTDVQLPPQAEIDAWFERTKDQVFA